MKTQARVVVIGGGVVGCGVLYHLTKFGWRDVLLVERSELTSGSTWHAAGGFHTLNADPNIAALQGYTIRLYRELEALTGQSCGLHHVGGLTIATDANRMDFLKAERAKHRHMDLETELVTPEEIKKLCPVLNIDDVVGALYDPLDGHLDPSGITQAYAKAARMGGAEISLRNRVVELPNRRWALLICYNAASNDAYELADDRSYVPLDRVPDEAIKQAGLKFSSSDQEHFTKAAYVPKVSALAGDD